MTREPLWRLRVSLIGPYGEKYEIATPIDHGVMREIACIEPPLRIGDLPMTSFEDTVTILRRKEFREQLFANECTRMGHLLAQRMADKEGWYGMDRADSLKDFGKPGVVR